MRKPTHNLCKCGNLKVANSKTCAKCFFKHDRTFIYTKPKKVSKVSKIHTDKRQNGVIERYSCNMCGIRFRLKATLMTHVCEGKRYE